MAQRWRTGSSESEYCRGGERLIPLPGAVLGGRTSGGESITLRMLGMLGLGRWCICADLVRWVVGRRMSAPSSRTPPLRLSRRAFVGVGGVPETRGTVSCSHRSSSSDGRSGVVSPRRKMLSGFCRSGEPRRDGGMGAGSGSLPSRRPGCLEWIVARAVELFPRVLRPMSTDERREEDAEDGDERVGETLLGMAGVVRKERSWTRDDDWICRALRSGVSMRRCIPARALVFMYPRICARGGKPGGIAALQREARSHTKNSCEQKLRSKDARQSHVRA